MATRGKAHTDIRRLYLQLALLSIVLILCPARAGAKNPLDVYLFVDFSGTSAHEWRAEFVDMIFDSCEDEDRLFLFGFNSVVKRLEATSCSGANLLNQALQRGHPELLGSNSRRTKFDVLEQRIDDLIEDTWTSDPRTDKANPEHRSRLVIVVTDGIHDPENDFPEARVQQKSKWTLSVVDQFEGASPKKLGKFIPAPEFSAGGWTVNRPVRWLIVNPAFCESSSWNGLASALRYRWGPSDTWEARCPTTLLDQLDPFELARFREDPRFTIESFKDLKIDAGGRLEMTLVLKSGYRSLPHLQNDDLALVVETSDGLSFEPTLFLRLSPTPRSSSQVLVEIKSEVGVLPEKIQAISIKRGTAERNPFRLTEHELIRGQLSPIAADASAHVGQGGKTLRTVLEYATLKLPLDKHVSTILGDRIIVSGSADEAVGLEFGSQSGNGGFHPCRELSAASPETAVGVRMNFPAPGVHSGSLPIYFKRVGSSAKSASSSFGAASCDGEGVAYSRSLEYQAVRYSSTLFHLALLSSLSGVGFLVFPLISTYWPFSRVRRGAQSLQVIERKAQLSLFGEIASIVSILVALFGLAMSRNFEMWSTDNEFRALCVALFVVGGFVLSPQSIGHVIWLVVNLLTGITRKSAPDGL